MLASFGAVVLASLCLWVAGAAMPLIFVFALMQGAGAGLMSILRPVLVADVLGRQGFGTISGAIAVAPILGSAAGPAAGAALLAAGGTDAVLLACGMMALAGLAAVVWLVRGQAGAGRGTGWI